MSKGCRRRPTEIPMEESILRWDIAFAKTAAERILAAEALENYMKRQINTYKEKRSAPI